MNEFIIDWDTFKSRFLKENVVFVIEEDSEFCFYTYVGPIIIKSSLVKPEDSTDLMLLKDEFSLRDNLVWAFYPAKEETYEYPQIDEGIYDEY